MLILYEENEVKFESLGLGVLKDALSAIVKESLNDSFEFKIDYPITGAFYNELKINRIITSKSSPYSNPQPFRIIGISKPISGIVTVSLVHISYDMNGIIVNPIKGSDLKNTLQLLESGSILEQNFKFFAEKQVLKSFTTNNYFNMRSLLFGSNESILEIYKQEIKFDKFNVYLMPTRGTNRGAEIRYGKNMTDLTHEISYENLYNGVYPYYHKEAGSSTVTATNDSFTEVYIVEGSTPLRDGWLSYSNGGEPYHPINESPVKVMTEGDYYGKVYTWDTTKQKYIERLIDQTVTLIEGVVEPEWIYIDWSKIPSITVKANKPGYFKMVTETEYVYHDVGDIVWQGSIRTVMSNLMLYYSEVIPQTSSYEEETNVDVTHVDLTDKILYLDTDAAKKMKINRILPLDLTSEFKDDEEPTDETLKEKALKYIRENKIGELKYNTNVSFIDLSSTTEGVEYKGFDKIELGDTVKISYEALDVDLELRVISTEYDALLDVYSNIELGEKSDNISSSSVQTGDNISSLSNDKDYQTQQQVVKIIADTITAEYIQAKNASFTKAQIEELQTARIRCTGIIEASQFDLDHLVAKFLTADNAEIKGVLKSGKIEVSGDITITSGEISIQNEDGSKTFSVDREGNLYANSATIEGNITASSGLIGGFTIGSNAIYNNLPTMDSENENGVYIGIDGISLGKQLKIYPDGTITSVTNNPSVAPESPEAKFMKASSKSIPVEQSSTPEPDYNFIDVLKASEVQAISNYNKNDVINISTAGTVDTLDVQAGDNIVVSVNPDTNNKIWLKLDPLKFEYAYNYRGEYNASIINSTTYSIGDVVKILSLDETLQNRAPGYTAVVGDYIIRSEWDETVTDTLSFETYNKSRYAIWRWMATQRQPSQGGGYIIDGLFTVVSGVESPYNITSATLVDPSGVEPDINVSCTVNSTTHNLSIYFYSNTNTVPSERYSRVVISGTYTTRSIVHHTGWKKFYYKDASDSFFGLTPDGILYANGAVISGDITVKSGEISIVSSDGLKTFNVTREGHVTANSCDIGILHVDSTTLHTKNYNTSYYGYALDFNDSRSKIPTPSSDTVSAKIMTESIKSWITVFPAYSFRNEVTTHTWSSYSSIVGLKEDEYGDYIKDTKPALRTHVRESYRSGNTWIINDALNVGILPLFYLSEIPYILDKPSRSGVSLDTLEDRGNPKVVIKLLTSASQSVDLDLKYLIFIIGVYGDMRASSGSSKAGSASLLSSNPTFVEVSFAYNSTTNTYKCSCAQAMSSATPVTVLAIGY